MQVWWKAEYGKSSGGHGTLAFFRTRLNRIAVTKELKKDVNACIDFISTVMKGHFLVCACGILGVTSLDGPLTLPPGLHKASAVEQLTFINDISKIVVERCSLVQRSLTNETVVDNNDGVSNYARILCHYSSNSVMLGRKEMETILRCWKLFMPHFKIAGCTKYSLEALKLQFQLTITSSPNLAHQITWNRFVNVKGGAGNNIPCDLFNEHVNKQLKYIICNMGSSLTETALQRAAQSVTSLCHICERFDAQSGVPCRTTAHSTRSDNDDIKKVVGIVLQNKLLENIGHREHRHEIESPV